MSESFRHCSHASETQQTFICSKSTKETRVSIFGFEQLMFAAKLGLQIWVEICFTSLGDVLNKAVKTSCFTVGKQTDINHSHELFM